MATIDEEVGLNNHNHVDGQGELMLACKFDQTQ